MTDSERESRIETTEVHIARLDGEISRLTRMMNRANLELSLARNPKSNYVLEPDDYIDEPIGNVPDELWKLGKFGS